MPQKKKISEHIKDKPDIGLSFDDVLIIPQYSDISSRKTVNVKTKFSRRININIPIVSANMDTVTEAAMAIAMARYGGIGVIHRFNSIDEQAEEVRKVKRAENVIIDDPITISKKTKLSDAVAFIKEKRISGLLVVDKNKKLEGIVTWRDVRFTQHRNVTVEKVMTPFKKLITASPDIKVEKAIAIFDTYKIEKLPLIDKDRILHGLITAADFLKINKYKNAAKDKNGRLVVAAAVGIKDGMERAQKLVETGVDALVVDIAHGHHKAVIDLVKKLKKVYTNVDIVAGNVATYQGAYDLIKAGADAIKVGIGPGAVCSTRVIAGTGVPQLTAILNSSKPAHQHNIPLIADGGIRHAGDVSKAIAAGASTIMSGSLFAGTKESPGEYFVEEDAAYKVYRGLASRDASFDRGLKEHNTDRAERAPEGVSARIVYKGDLNKVLFPLIDGFQSGMSYVGAKNIGEFWGKATFIRTSKAGHKEGLPRSLNS
ncbi:IMP dehydrogenase [Patescibacteria group bacterium AH-259-L05]|nr:IMP dehydrogenase [Patescibacteria group bacterium AH-259-L05]